MENDSQPLQCPRWSRWKKIADIGADPGNIVFFANTVPERDPEIPHCGRGSTVIAGPLLAGACQDRVKTMAAEKGPSQDILVDDDNQAIRQSEERYRFLFENMREGFAYCRMLWEDGQPRDFTYLGANRAFETLTGLKNVVGKKVSEVIPGIQESDPELFQIYGRVASAGGSEHFEMHVKSLGIWFSVSVYSPAYDYFVAVFENITERKRAEAELKAKNAELERFTYTASHDLKSPLITIQGFIGQIEEDLARGKFDRMTDDIRRIRNAAQRMQQLLDDLLELSRIGRVVSPSQEVRLGDLAAEAVRLLAGRLTPGGIRVDIPAGLPKVYGDPQRLREVLQNLIENAAKFMGPQAEPKIEIGGRIENGRVLCFVRDNGIGIEARHRDRIFGLFDKLDPKSEGTGVGLALVKRIVEAHGGETWAESAGADAGSTFYFTLPAGKQ